MAENAKERRIRERSMPMPGMDVNQCLCCKWLRECGDPLHVIMPLGWRCEAFPDKDIPPVIVKGYVDHRKPWCRCDDYPEGDRGIRFEDSSEDGYTWQEILDFWGAPAEYDVPKSP